MGERAPYPRSDRRPAPTTSAVGSDLSRRSMMATARRWSPSSGLILEENGRMAIRLAPLVPPDAPARPGSGRAAARAAFKWEPARTATLRPTELASAVLAAFRGAVGALAELLCRRPGRLAWM